MYKAKAIEVMLVKVRRVNQVKQELIPEKPQLDM